MLYQTTLPYSYEAENTEPKAWKALLETYTNIN